jgi:hypothetical protein
MSRHAAAFTRSRYLKCWLFRIALPGRHHNLSSAS